MIFACRERLLIASPAPFQASLRENPSPFPELQAPIPQFPGINLIAGGIDAGNYHIVLIPDHIHPIADRIVPIIYRIHLTRDRTGVTADGSILIIYQADVIERGNDVISDRIDA